MIKNGVYFGFFENTSIEIKNLTPFRLDVRIPRVFSSDHVVDKIATYGSVYGKFGRIIIEDDIKTICDGAFTDVDAKEVVWPLECNHIPDSCFYHSMVNIVSNVEHVTSIGDGAFQSSGIKEFSWPTDCKVIPSSCFLKSKIESLHNIEHISSIEEYAFYEAKRLKLDLSGTTLLNIPSFSFGGVSKENIIFPYYIDIEESKDAFKSNIMDR